MCFEEDGMSPGTLPFWELGKAGNGVWDFWAPELRENKSVFL